MRPVVLREGSPAHRAYVRGAWAVAALVVLWPPLSHELGITLGSLDQPARIAQLTTVVAFAVAILGLDLVVGYSGQLALGQSAFVGLGAYTTVILVADRHWSFYFAVPVTAVVCFLAGLLVGIPATRVKGVYLAIVTLVIAFTFPALVVRLDWLTGGSNGRGPRRGQGKLLPPSWVPFADAGRLAGPLWIYCLCVALATALFVAARNVVHSRPGRALVTMRDHEPAAVALGANVALYKAMSFGASAMYGGLAGAMLMMGRPFASDAMFNYRMSIFLLAALVIGGTGTISGAVPGAIAYVFVPFYLTQWAFDQGGLPAGVRVLTRPLFALFRPAGGDAGAIFFGCALIALTFVLPGGVIAGVRQLRARVVTVERHPAWLDGHPRAAPLVVTPTASRSPGPAPSVAPVSWSPGPASAAVVGPGPAIPPVDVDVEPVVHVAPEVVHLDGAVVVPVRIVASPSADATGDPDARWRP